MHAFKMTNRINKKVHILRGVCTAASLHSASLEPTIKSIFEKNTKQLRKSSELILINTNININSRINTSAQTNSFKSVKINPGKID